MKHRRNPPGLDGRVRRAIADALADVEEDVDSWLLRQRNRKGTFLRILAWGLPAALLIFVAGAICGRATADPAPALAAVFGELNPLAVGEAGAHPGRTAADGCHGRRGETERHWHADGSTERAGVCHVARIPDPPDVDAHCRAEVARLLESPTYYMMTRAPKSYAALREACPP